MKKYYLNIVNSALIFIFCTVFAASYAQNVPGGGTGTGPNVTLVDNGSTITLANGIVSIVIDKTNGSISTFNYKNMNLFAGGTGGGKFYWTWNMPTFSGPNGTASIVTNPNSNGGNYAEVKIRTPWSGLATDAAMDVDIYYSLSRGNQGYYAAATLSHPANYPSNPGGEWRCNAYVGSTFNWFSLDSLRNNYVPTIADVAAELPVAGAPKEVTLMTSGVYKGKYFCKYSLSADLGDLDVWGWTSETQHVGIWMTVPSHEYYNGGPMKRELTGHQGNTLLNMLGGGHYGIGGKADMDSGVVVKKTFGPFLVYANSYSGSASDPVKTVANALWKDAKAQAAAEQAAWPYTWFKNADYVQASGRGTLIGTLKISDIEKPAAIAKNCWIGLAPESNGTEFQHQQNRYQFWVKTDNNGNFTIPDIIAGTYNLYAFGGGFSGEFKKSNITIGAAKTLNLGNITWTIERLAPTVFEIGIPNRDSKEFKNGDFNYSQWQSYLDIPTDYPNGVNYTVGTSDWSKDWNYGLREANSWNINFNLKEAPYANTNASFYLSLASNFRTRLDIYVNNTKVNASQIYPENSSNAMIRLGSHGLYSDMRITIPANLFVKGTNKIKITQSGGEVEFDYLRLEAEIPNVILTKSGPTTFCEGGNLTITSSTGKSYRWFNGTTLLTNTSQSLNVTTDGTYKVEVTNTNGTKDTSDIVRVIVNPLPVINQYVKIDAGSWKTSTTVNVCVGSSIYFGPSPTNATGWTWVGPNNYTSTSRTPTLLNTTSTQSGVYKATYSDANGCSSSVSYNVVINALPIAKITASGATTFCNGGSVILTSSTGTSYVWRNGTTTVATTASYTAKTAGSYSVIVTNASGCKDTSAATTVTVNALPTATITASGATTFCNGGSVNLTSSTGSSYVWKNGTTTVATTASYTAKTVGNYTVIVTNASGCKDTSAATTVTVNALPTATITASGATTFCNGGSVNLTASTGTFYVWRNGTTTVGTTASYLAKTAGNYTVIVTNASGCKDTSAATTVTVNALPTATITASGATTFCNGGSVNLTSSTATSYVWRNGTTTVATTASYLAKTAGNYTVIVSNASGCKDTSAASTVTVNALPTATITASGATTFCNGGSVNLTSSTGASYVWRNGSTTVATTASYTAKTAGNYTVIVTNASGCKDTSTTTTVTVNALPTATITSSGATTFCNGGSVNLTSSTGSSYVWRNGTTTVATTVSYLAKTAGSYTVIVTNASGCKDTSTTTTVTVNALPTATITASGATTFCNGGSVNLTSSTGSSYVWRNGATTVGTTASYLAKTAGNYTVIVTNASGCKDTSTATTVTVNALSSATITASGATTFCNGGSVNLTSSTGSSYVWRNGTTTVGTTASYSAKTAGSYTVIVTNASGCKDTSVATVVTVNATATPSNITGDDIVCANSTSRTYSITNIADATAYTWTVPTGASITSGANTNAIVVSFASTSGDVSVSATNGCGVGSIVKKAVSITTNCITFEALSTKTSIDLTWDIAGINVKTIQIMRNTSASTTGRVRLVTVGNNPQNYSDTSALDNTDYWYWLKITDVNNVVYNSNSVQGKIAVVTGVNPITSNETEVYPNPYEHDFQIKKQGIFHYSIEDLHGKTLLKGEAENETFTGNSLPTGVYILKIIANNNTEVVKVVKK